MVLGRKTIQGVFLLRPLGTPYKLRQGVQGRLVVVEERGRGKGRGRERRGRRDEVGREGGRRERV